MGIIALFFYLIASDTTYTTIRFKDTRAEFRENLYKDINNKELLKSPGGQLQINTYRFIACSLMGEGCTGNPQDVAKQYDKSLLGQLTHAIALPYANAPASGTEWAYNGLQNAGLTTKTYAQGVGFAGLRPITPIWKAFRDIAYMILVLAMVSVGFLIMFRYKIDAQTVISIENALPRFVITLLVITFSYPIAGFLIDVMYICMGLAMTLLIPHITGSLVTGGDISEYTRHIYTYGAGSLWDMVTSNNDIFAVGPALLGMLPYAIQIILNVLVGIVGAVLVTWGVKTLTDSFFSGFLFGGLIGGALVVIAGSIGFFIFTALVPLILGLFVWITVFFLFFRILFMLFTTYTRILLWIIFAPLYLLQELIPGRNAFGDWTKTVFVHLLTFPIVIVLIIISAMMGSIEVNSTGTGAPVLTHGDTIWMPPFLYTRSAEGFIRLVGMVILVGIPTLTQTIKASLGVKDQGLGVGVASLFGGITGLAGGALGLNRAIVSQINPHAKFQETPLGRIKGVNAVLSRIPVINQMAGLKPGDTQNASS